MKTYEVLYRIRRPARRAGWVVTFGLPCADGPDEISQRSTMASDAGKAPRSRAACLKPAQGMGAAYGRFC